MRERERVITPCSEVSRTKQSFAEECDVNTIVERYKSTGALRQVVDVGEFLDVSDRYDLREALDRVHRAEESFLSLPSEVRARFQNDPAAFLEFCQDEQNFDELVELGLVEKSPGASSSAAPVPGDSASPKGAAVEPEGAPEG